MNKLFSIFISIIFGLWSGTILGQGNDCAGAQSLTVNVGSCNFSSATNSGLTNSGQVPEGADCDFFAGGDAWYSLVLPPSGEVTIATAAIAGTTPPSLNINAAAYSGTCGNLTLIDCDASSGPDLFPELILSGDPGETLFIQLWETSNNIQGDFNICANGTAICTPPTVDLLESCAGDNEYEVSLFVLSLGDASSLSITNDGGAQSINNVSSAGTYTVGPFPLGSTPTITVVHNDDNTCNVSQQVTSTGLACENVLTCGIALDQSYCYRNNDNTSFFYSSEDGSPLTLTFLSGELEDVNDQITIRNGSDASAPILFQGSNGGNLSGIVETASSGSIFMTVSSDASGSCEDGSFNLDLGWDWQVECESCTSPAATFAVVEDCLNGTFTVDVGINSLGTSTTVSIENDAGEPATTGIGATGVYSVGPFTIGMPVQVTVSSENFSSCAVGQGGLDFTCPPPPNCDNAISIISQTTFAASEISGDVSSSLYSQVAQCSGPDSNPDPFFTFTAVGSTSYIRVETSGDFDPAIEVFDACGGNLLACINEAGAGQRELFWVNDLTPGEQYVYRVYHAGQSSPATTTFATAVAHIPFVRLRPADCGATELISNSLIRTTLPDPNFLLTGYVFEFTELEEPFQTYEVVSPNGSNPNFFIGWFGNFEYGRSYEVRVKARMYQGANLGEYGTACIIAISEGSTTSLLPNFTDGFYDMCDYVKAKKVLGSTNYRWVFDDGQNQLEYNSGNASPICPLQSVQGLQLGTSYSVTVFATNAQGVETTQSTPGDINMNGFVPDTEVNPLVFTCGVTVPANQVLNSVEVCSAEQYTFRFTNLTLPEIPPIEVIRPNRLILLSLVSGLLPGSTYSVAVKANSGGLEGEYATECEITLEGLSGLVISGNQRFESPQVGEYLAMLVFPNPTSSGEVNISLDTDRDIDQIVLEVFDLQGKKLISEISSGSSLLQKLNLNMLKKGIYLLQVRSESELLSSRKLIID